MRTSGVRLFTWLQGAAFYRALHEDAVRLLPPGCAQQWLDVGCGPGLVTRLAAARGYAALGLDSDQGMIAVARRLACWVNSPARFEVRGVFELAPASADVVSACSLLAVLADKERGLAALWSAVRPGGTLLLVEPTEKMAPLKAEQLIAAGLPAKRLEGLRLWARAREGKSVPVELIRSVDAASVHRTDMLAGLVSAWRLRRAAA